MSRPDRAAARRAERLLRCYPARWRARYGEEFTQLLIDDFAERPRSLTRTVDVVRCGLNARLTHTGLSPDSSDADRQIRTGLAALGCAIAAFMAFGIAIWSQLTIGWQWSAPKAPATKVAMVVMSAAVVGFVTVALLSALPLGWTVYRELRRGRTRRLVGPLALASAGMAALILGSIHFGHGWPGTGGHPWADRGLVPAGVARFCWAATLWITSYWAHPGALSSFPAAEVAWMVASPIALAATLVGAARTLQWLPLSPRVLRYEAWLGTAATAAMAAFLAGAGSWVISGGPAPHRLFTVGAIDNVGLVVMAAALVLAFRAAERAIMAPPGSAAAS